MSDLLNQLNETQREAAAHTEGPVMIIAGAGSGKTRTLTYRIAHMIESGVDPFNILALTFTNKAAKEMKDRIVSLVGSNARNIWMGTFHSVFARVLRAEASKLGYISTFTIYDTDDSKSAINSIVKSLGLDTKEYKANYVLSRISMAKSNLFSPEDYCNNVEIQQADKTARKTEIGRIYTMYNQRLRQSMAMDFDDLLYNMNLLLRDFPDVLYKYQERFRYILVDEYQDTNHSQYQIVKKLAARYQNICVVGDDAQSIYAFRGANIENILNFKRDYPSVSLFKLEQNYRSTQTIVNASNSIISNNHDQIKKHVWTGNSVGDPIKLFRATDERDEGNKVADSIVKNRIDKGLNYKDFAILYRTNSQSRAIEDSLKRMNVPYRIYQGISFYGRKEVKDVLAYMRLVVNNHDDESLIRAINYPRRGIGDTSLNKIRLAASDNGVSIWTVLENLSDFGLGLGSSISKVIADFVIMIQRFTSVLPELDAYSIAKQIVHSSGIVSLLRNDPDPDNPNRIENIEELLNGVKEFCDQSDDIAPDLIEQNAQIKTLDLFLQQVLLMTSEDKGKDDDSDKVSLMTIHAAKGLEFPHVYVVGMEENLFPSFMSMNSRQELEEERRLFYVAVTRAESQLNLSCAVTRYMNGSSSCQEMSRFVQEIDDKFIEKVNGRGAFPPAGTFPKAFANAGKPQIPSTPRKTTPISDAVKGPTMANSPADIARICPGSVVSHEKFGTGKVLRLEGVGSEAKAIVFFDGVGEKTLLLKYAKLSIL